MQVRKRNTHARLELPVASRYPHPPGTWYGYVGNVNNAIGSIHQFITIPANATSASLTFYLNIVTYETDAIPDDDKLEINFRHETYLIENPVSTVSSYWRKPDYTFAPCDYGGYLNPSGDAYTKRTCLWTGNGFVMPEPRRVFPIEGSRMNRLPPSKDRAALRSVTPKGFAQAVFEANSSCCLSRGLTGLIRRFWLSAA